MPASNLSVSSISDIKDLNIDDNDVILKILEENVVVINKT